MIYTYLLEREGEEWWYTRDAVVIGNHQRAQLIWHYNQIFKMFKNNNTSIIIIVLQAEQQCMQE